MKRGAPTHPKVYDLASRMNIPHALAVGYLELLWHFTARYAPQGDVGRHSDDSIAKACLYQGVPSRLVSALCAAGWLDVSPRYRLVVHDWHEHADDVTKKHLSRKNLPFLSYTEELTGHSPDKYQSARGQVLDTDRISAASRAHVPLPKPSHSLAIAKPTSDFPPLDSPVETAVIDFRELHPKPSNEQQVAVFFAEHFLRLGEDPEKFREWVKPIRNSLGRYCEYWGVNGVGYAPKLTEWLRDEGWKKAPPDPPAQPKRMRSAIEIGEEMDRLEAQKNASQ